jgi:hypothetical protein
MTDRRGNVYENKGSAFHSPRQSGNVTENTGSYEFKAGMLLKRKAGFRSQESGFRNHNSDSRQKAGVAQVPLSRPAALQRQ